MDNSSGSHANNIYSLGKDKLTEMQLYMSTSCQSGSRVIPAFSGVEKPCLISDQAVIATKSENKIGFSTSKKARISCRVNKIFIDTAARGIATSFSFIIWFLCHDVDIDFMSDWPLLSNLLFITSSVFLAFPISLFLSLS